MTIVNAEILADPAGILSISLDKSRENLPGEVWKAHPVHDLDVSNLGRVRSLSGNIIGSTKLRKSKAAHGVRLDYVRVSTSTPSGRVAGYNHVLVLETFVGPRPEDHDGDHIDRDIFNNRADNLRWRPANENRATR